MYTRDAGEVLIGALTVVEEVSHSLGQLLMVVGVRDEVFLGATYTFAGAIGREAVEDLDNGIVYEASQYVPLVGGLLHFVSV